MIPGLENAEFARYGVMHRNTFINSPKLLTPSYRFKKRDHLYFAGQITGVEGYVESIASGLVAGINAYRTTAGMEELVFPASTAIGALAHYISTSSMGNFQPMNINFGIMDTKDSPVHSKTNVGKKVTARQKKQEKNLQIANRALKMIQLLKDN